MDHIRKFAQEVVSTVHTVDQWNRSAPYKAEGIDTTSRVESLLRAFTNKLNPANGFTPEELLGHIDNPNGAACLRIWKEHGELFAVSPASSDNHQAWPGGYLKHLTDVMNKGMREYDDFVAVGAMEALPPEEGFELGDVLLVLFLHDLEKPWKYLPDAPCPLEVGEISTKAQRRNFRWRMMQHYGIQLSGNQLNAMEYVEGVRDADYSPSDRTIWPLGLICHIADYWSARAAYNFGRPATP